MNYYQIAVNFPKLNSILTYGSVLELKIGDLVEVPLGRRKSQGVILKSSEKEDLEKVDHSKLKEVSSLLSDTLSLSEKELSLFMWMSRYYHYPIGKLVFDFLPKIMKRPRKPNFIKGQGLDIPFKLSDNQTEVATSLINELKDGFKQSYIHGVTGSGKSAVYLTAMKEVLDSGQSVQFLLPEINLTPQFTNMFETFLNCKVLTYHSGVTASEKYNIWKSLNESDEPVLIMGVRSSIFLPVSKLGLIIVDEEHDQSFKQSDRCPYNGRDVAIKKAQLHDCPIVLGSATPSVENYHGFSTNEKRNYFTLKERANNSSFPSLTILDVTNRFKEKDAAWPLLDETIEKIEKAVKKDEQVLVFINKLGFASFVQCRNCSHQFFNENCGCQNNLRYFRQKNCLSCAHCDFVMPMPEQCPECGGMSLMNKGFGTEKVAEVLTSLFPNYNVDRFDRDEIKNTKDLTAKLDAFHEKKIDILVGTQMLAKGHNFKRVNLVVILGIDSMLNYADFRSTEKTYQLVEQVSGRAGRYSDDSEVVIQTMNPDHGAFKFIQEHSFDGLYKEELPLRELCHCPPFSKVIMLYFSSRFRDRLITTINTVAKSLHSVCAKNFSDVRLLGPTPLGIEKKANQFTWAIMLKSDNVNQLHGVVSTFEANYQDISGVSFKIDVDPQQVL